jgi:hypothetical protein
MFVRTVIVGINHWPDLTKPFADSLQQYNPALSMVIIDNASEPPYPDYSQRVLRVERCGYGQALNAGAYGNWNWLLCCNNDCTCSGVVDCSHLRTDTIYGNAWKYDYDGMQDGLPAVVDSAYFLIPRRIWDHLGGFDPGMDAAFEEIDLQIRALDLGYRIDVADLPITHLNLHTRWELEDYGARWSKTQGYFRKKHPARKLDTGAHAPEVNYGN